MNPALSATPKHFFHQPAINLDNIMNVVQNLSIFGFRHTNSEKLLTIFPGNSKVLLDSSQIDIEKYVEKVKLERPQYVLGLGEYSGKDSNHLRVEVLCSNKFRNSILGSKVQQIEYKPFIKIKEKMPIKRAYGIGTSWCNLVSYKLLTSFSSDEINYTFIHIPKTFNLQLAKDTILEGITF